MRRRGPLLPACLGLVALAAIACGAFGAGDPEPATPDAGSDAAGPDAAEVPDGTTPDASRPICDLTAPFAPAKPVAGLPGDAIDRRAPRLSADENALYFTEGNGAIGRRIMWAERLPDGSFGPLMPLAITGSAVSSDELRDPSLTADDQRIFFASSKPDGGWSLGVAMRSGEGFKSAQILPFSSSFVEPFASAASSELFATEDRALHLPGTPEFVIVRTSQGATPPPPTAVAGISGDAGANTSHATLSFDGLTLYFAREVAAGDYDIFVATRPAHDAPFGEPHAVSELRTTSTEAPGWLSPDQCRLYFETTRARPDSDPSPQHPFTIWVAERPAPGE